MKRFVFGFGIFLLSGLWSAQVFGQSPPDFILGTVDGAYKLVTPQAAATAGLPDQTAKANNCLKTDGSALSWGACGTGTDIDPSDATPKVSAGGGVAGSSSDYSRGDHAHPAPPMRALSDAKPAPTGAAAVTGTATAASRGDHVHNTTFSPQAPKLSGTAAAGSSELPARSDHIHPKQPSELPSLSGEAGKVLTVNTDASGVEWTAKGSGAETGPFKIVQRADTSDSSARTWNPGTVDVIAAARKSGEKKLFLLQPNTAGQTLSFAAWDVSSGARFECNFNRSSSNVWTYVATGSQNCTSGVLIFEVQGASGGGAETPLSNALPKVAGTAAAGGASAASRGDHVHPTQPLSSFGTVGTDGLCAKSDGSGGLKYADCGSPRILTNKLPKVAGTAAPGSDTQVSRSDHVHPLQPAAPLSDKTPTATNAAADAGTGTSASREDHIHNTTFSGLAPKAAGTARAGSSEIPARSDHIHPKQPSELPSLSGEAGKVLTVKTDASGVEWTAKGSGAETGPFTIVQRADTSDSSARTWNPGTVDVIAVARKNNQKNLFFLQPNTAGQTLFFASYDPQIAERFICYFNRSSSNVWTYVATGSRQCAQGILIFEVQGASGGGSGGPPLSDADPQPTGTAAPGTATSASRSDHVHFSAGGGSTTPLSDTTPLGDTTAGDAGTSTSASRDDHQHPTSDLFEDIEARTDELEINADRTWSTNGSLGEAAQVAQPQSGCGINEAASASYTRRQKTLVTDDSCLFIRFNVGRNNNADIHLSDHRAALIRRPDDRTTEPRIVSSDAWRFLGFSRSGLVGYRYFLLLSGGVVFSRLDIQRTTDPVTRYLGDVSGAQGFPNPLPEPFSGNKLNVVRVNSDGDAYEASAPSAVVLSGLPAPTGQRGNYLRVKPDSDSIEWSEIPLPPTAATAAPKPTEPAIGAAVGMSANYARADHVHQGPVHKSLSSGNCTVSNNQCRISFSSSILHIEMSRSDPYVMFQITLRQTVGATNLAYGVWCHGTPIPLGSAESREFYCWGPRGDGQAMHGELGVTPTSWSFQVENLNTRGATSLAYRVTGIR